MDARAEVVARMIEAINDHDLDAMLESFKPDYRSEQPVHPARTFQGAEQVRKNWGTLLEAVPDLHWEVLRLISDDSTAWVEARLTGTKADGTKLDEIGVIIFGVSGGHIGWARLYLEDVETESGDIEETVRHMAGR
jgi:limonene-1,2-epoxide hydrolase